MVCLNLLLVFVTIFNLDWQGESCTRRHDKLKGEVMMMFHDKEVDPLEQLELIDILQRVGLSYHFEDEIRRILEGVYMNTNHGDHGTCKKEKNLYATALEFRLLRQHGYSVPQGKRTT
jgi:(-)-alpha-terpineol synthase